MKTFLVLSIIFLTACTKKNHNLPPDYDQFIGVWETINTSENAVLDVKKNGLIELSHAVDRNTKCIVKSWLPYNQPYKGSDWVGYRFSDGKKTNVEKNQFETTIGLFLNLTRDSLICTDLRSNIINGMQSQPNVTAIFTKK
jgi:hypothetical protein